MSLLFSNLARYVAKTMFVIAIIAFMHSEVDAQKRRGSSKPKIAQQKSKKQKKVTRKLPPRPRSAPKSSSAKIASMPVPSHHFLHFTEESWQDAVAIMSIYIFERFNDGVISYKIGVSPSSDGERRSINWDKNTVFVDLGRTNAKFNPVGCFVVIYCKAHTMALFLQRIQCM